MASFQKFLQLRGVTNFHIHEEWPLNRSVGTHSALEQDLYCPRGRDRLLNGLLLLINVITSYKCKGRSTHHQQHEQVPLSNH